MGWLPVLALLAQVGGVSFTGLSVSVSNSSPRAFWQEGQDVTVDQWVQSTGSVSIDGTDRVSIPGATWGDDAHVRAEITANGDTWVVELDQPGFPLTATSPQSPLRAWVRYPMSGGLIVDADIGGQSGLGMMPGTMVHAAASVVGVGTVLRNGQPITDSALVEIDALSAGNHADDGTFRTLPEAREGDAEVLVFATNLPTHLVPQGFIRFGFEDVQINLGGALVASELTVPTVGATPATVGAGTLTASLGLPVTPIPTGVGGAGTAGQGTTTPAGAPTGSGFSSTGLPATPPVANNGSTTSPSLGTPQPANNTPATPLAQSPQPLNAQPATPLPGQVPATPTLGPPAPGTTTATPVASPTAGLPATPTPSPSGPIFTSPTGLPNGPSAPGGTNPAAPTPAAPPTAPTTPGAPAVPGAPAAPATPGTGASPGGR